MKKVLLNEPYLKGNEIKYLTDVIQTTWLSRGKYVKEFETRFANTIAGVEYGLAVTSGTVAVHIALRAVGVHGDKEVIKPIVAIPTYTCMSVPAAVKHANCEPAFVGVEEETWGMDLKKLQELCKYTKIDAVILVHSYGHIARDSFEIAEFCKAKGIKLVEDASESHGAEANGVCAGQIGDVAAFSCRSEKMIGVGEGGVVVSNDLKVIDEAYYWVNDARASEKIRYYVTDIGWNFHMANALGAIGLAQVEQFKTIVAKKRQVAKWYEQHFKYFIDNGYMSTIKPRQNTNPVYWLNCYIIEDEMSVRRDDLMTMLEERGFETRPGFYALQNLRPYRQNLTTPCKVSTRLQERLIALPSSVNVTEEDIIRLKGDIIDACKI